MEHARDIELIEMAGGTLPEGRRATLQRHLADCPDCRRRLDAVAGTHAALGRWDVSPAGHDVAARVMAMAANPPADHVIGRLIWPLARAAAVVAVGLAVGYVGGRWITAAPSAPPAGEEAVIRTLHLDALGAQPALADTILDHDWESDRGERG